MNLQDTPARYGAVSVFNHWLGAALIVALLAIGLYFEDMPRGEEKLYWLRLHIALGTLALLPLAFRVYWRARSASPAPLPQPPVLQKASRVLHIALLSATFTVLMQGRPPLGTDFFIFYYTGLIRYSGADGTNA